jgi:hypothetical protein
MDAATKKLIDQMPYTEMFSKWRFAPVGDPMFQGEVGDYFAKVMKDKRIQVGDAEHTRISKQLGWGN